MKQSNTHTLSDQFSHQTALAHRSRSAMDFLILIGGVASFFGLAIYFELSEKVTQWGSGYEKWQLDELPLTLLTLSIGLAWFALRRKKEANGELAERIYAEKQVADLLAHNRELSQRLILAQESERRALARELHDEIGQDCTAIRAEATYLMHAADDHQTVVTSAQRIINISESLYTLVKEMLRRLRPAALDSLGLEPALQELCESWEQSSGVDCGFFPRNIPLHLGEALSITVYRLVQEGLTNVSRHAAADQVRIDLHLDAAGEHLVLSITDNGRGMPKPDELRPGFGLIGMRERVAALHGTICLHSNPGEGLRIEAGLPITEHSS